MEKITHLHTETNYVCDLELSNMKYRTLDNNRRYKRQDRANALSNQKTAMFNKTKSERNKTKGSVFAGRIVFR